MFAWVWLAGGCTPDSVHLGPPTVTTSRDVSVEAAAQGWQVGNRFKKGRGCTVGDFDLDGDDDLLLAHPADESFFLLNTSTPGRLSFTPGPVLFDDETVWNFAAIDLEGDGDLDLFANFGGLEGQLFDQLLINQVVETGELVFVDATADSGLAGPLDDLGRILPTASLDGQWLDYDLDGDVDLWVDTSHYPNFFANPVAVDNGRSQLYRNDGGAWTEVAEEVGLGAYGSARFSSWLDLDNDGDLDLHHNIDKQDHSDTYRNDSGTFVRLENGWGIDGADARYPINSFVSATADVNQDGWEDLVKFARGYPTEGPHRLGHTLFLNARGRGFVDATELSNLNDPFLDGTLHFFRDHETNGVMGATVRDVNGDGIPDVLVGNGGPGSGYPRALMLSTHLEVHDFGGDIGELAVPVYATQSQLVDVAAEEDPASGLVYPPYPYRGHAICVSDFDGDGLPDAYYMDGGMQYLAGDAAREPNQLFTFDVTPRPHHLSVRLRGDGVTVPFTPVGSRIAVTAAREGVEWTVWDRLRTIEGFSAQHGEWRWFGLSDADRIVEVRVQWTDGTETVVEEVDLDSKIEVAR